MSEENVKLARSMYEAFNRRDWNRGLALRPPILSSPFSRGRTRALIEGAKKCSGSSRISPPRFPRWIVEPEEFFERDDVVVAFVKFRLQPKGSDAEFEIRIGNLWTIRDGKLLSAEGFPEREKALEAAGLSE